MTRAASGAPWFDGAVAEVEDSGSTTRGYVRSLRSHWIVILSIVVVALAGTLAYTQAVQKRYQAQALVVVTPIPQGNSSYVGVGGLLQDSAQGQPVVTAAQFLSSPQVGQEVKSSLGIKKLPPITVTPMNQSNTVAIQAEASTPAAAARYANAYGEAALALRERQLRGEALNEMGRLATQLRGLSPQTSATDAAIANQINRRLAQLNTLVNGPDPTMSILTPATAPSSASWPQTKLSLLVAFASALLLGGVVAIVLDLITPVIRDEEDIRGSRRLPIVARVPYISDAQLRRQLSGAGSTPARLHEGYRQLRAMLPRPGFRQDLLVIVVCSAGSAEGRTSTAIGLATAVAATERRVVVVDGDMREPSANLLGEPIVGGLPAVLEGRQEVAQSLIALSRPNLALLPATPDPNASDLLAAERLTLLLDDLRQDADVVIIDAPPVSDNADAQAFAAAADAVLLCARLGHTDRRAFEDMLQRLRQPNLPPTGIVVVDRKPHRGSKDAPRKPSERLPGLVPEPVENR